MSAPIRDRLAPALTLIFTLSGASGLCFEIMWARQLSVAVGATSVAIAAVVGLFMAGLAVGSALGARLATRLPRPGRAYGFTELGIGVSAALVTVLLPSLEGLGSVSARWLLAAPVLLVPSSLMGLTYPLVTQAVGTDRSGPARLYAANTAGGMLGCLAAGFLGIGLLGVRDTAWLAAALNLACGAAALRLFGAGEAVAIVAPASASSPPSTARPLARRLILAAAALAGASALAAEILWTRALVPYLNSSTYAFAAILATYLGGLAVGAALVARRGARALPTLALLASVLAVLAVVIALTTRSILFADLALPAYVGVRRVTSLASWLATVAAVFAKAAIVVVPPTLLMGAAYPLCIRALAETGVAPGAAAGRVGAVNTLGGIAGSLLAGFVLLPLCGVSNAIVLCATATLVAAALVVTADARVVADARAADAPTVTTAEPSRGIRRRLFVLLAAAAVLPLARSGDTTPFLGRLTAGGRVVLVDEGRQDTTAVVDRIVDGRQERVILSNGISYAGDAPLAQRYMTLLGVLPTLLSADPSDSLVICAGTGTTAASVVLFDEVHRLDLVDISPVVHRTLPLFVPVNRSIWLDPRVTIHEADGRQFMTRAPRRYGVITLEPPPPRAAGAASLYAIGFYRRARASMRPDGVIAQWLPLHGMTEAETIMLARTFVEVFPDAALFFLSHEEAALVGSPSALAFDGDRARRRLAEPRVRAQLAAIGLRGGDAESLFAELVAMSPVSGPALRQLVGPGPVVTDDQPLIEQFGVGLGQPGDPDGRTGLARRVLAAEASEPQISGRAVAGVAEARAELRRQMQRWIAPRR